MTLFARTPAVTADVDHVMSGLNMMITPATVVNSVFCTQPPLTPGCEFWCTQCTSQRCAVRGLHELHVCMGCEHTMKFSTPVGGGGWRSLGRSRMMLMDLYSLSCGLPNRYRYYLELAYSDIDFCSWSEDDYYGHYLLEKRN